MTRMTLVLQFDDGAEERIEYEPVASDDPAIRERLVSGTGPAEREIVTRYRPTSERPASYPVDLPFIRGVGANTNEFPESGRPPRARWRVWRRSDWVFRELERQSTAAGWTPDPDVRLPGFPQSQRLMFLRRDATVRRISQHRLGWFASLIELEDVPADLALRGPSPDHPAP